MSSLKLSPKYGLNPTIPTCFWCGEEKNEIVLLGHIQQRSDTGKAVRGSDVKAPRKMVMDYDPCECCAEKFKRERSCVLR